MEKRSFERKRWKERGEWDKLPRDLTMLPPSHFFLLSRVFPFFPLSSFLPLPRLVTCRLRPMSREAFPMSLDAIRRTTLSSRWFRENGIYDTRRARAIVNGFAINVMLLSVLYRVDNLVCCFMSEQFLPSQEQSFARRQFT